MRLFVTALTRYRAAVPLDAVALAAVLLRVQLEVYRFADCTALAVVVFALTPSELAEEHILTARQQLLER